MVGQQFAGRVGFFLRVDDFDAAYARMQAAGVEFVTAPRVEPYGQVAVFLDLEGNRWDLLGLTRGYTPGHDAPRRLVLLPVAPAPAAVTIRVVWQAPAPSPAGAATVC